MTRKALIAISMALVACAPGGAQGQELGSRLTINLAPGRYEGPIVISKPVSLVGAPGVVIVGPDDQPVVTVIDTTGVTIRDLRIEGGSDGILVRRSEGVSIREVTVEQSLWHGIVAQDSEVHIASCEVLGLRAPMPQGVEIINSDARPPSSVTDCRVHGPVFEGIVSHVSHVTFEGNTVTGATARGVVITEMSDGLMQGNVVSESAGNAYFCGDMSFCAVVDNRAIDISQGADHRSAQGHGLVVHFHSHAYVSGLDVDGLDGDIALLMLESGFLDESPYP